MDIKKEVAKALFSNDIGEMKEILLDVYVELRQSNNIKKMTICGIGILLSNIFKVRSMLFGGQKGYIPAIKFLREAEDLGLKEAKDIVDFIRSYPETGEVQ